MIDKIDIPIYNTSVALLIEINTGELEDFYSSNKSILSQKEYEDLKNDIFNKKYEGLTLYTDSNHFLVYLRNGKSDNIVSHEIFHVCNKILLDRGVSFDADAEAWAYLIGWFTEEYYRRYWDNEDKKNSTFECIKFKKKVPNITYAEVTDKLFLGNSVYYTESNGGIGKIPSSFVGCGKCRESNNASSKEQLHRILTLNQLFNIAQYYNGDWEPSDRYSGYFIVDTPSDGYCVGSDVRSLKAFPRFRNEKDALAVIANPNFRPILDSIFK